MGLKSRRKGKRGELEVVALAKAHQLHAYRSWTTAQLPDARLRNCDVVVEGQPYQCQIEARGFARLYHELEGVEGFFCRADRHEWLVALRASNFLRLLRLATSSQEGGHEETV